MEGIERKGRGGKENRNNTSPSITSCVHLCLLGLHTIICVCLFVFLCLICVVYSVYFCVLLAV